MLNLECSYGYAHMTTLMRLVAIQMTDDALFAINDLHLLAFRQPDALLYTKGIPFVHSLMSQNKKFHLKVWNYLYKFVSLQRNP